MRIGRQWHHVMFVDGTDNMDGQGLLPAYPALDGPENCGTDTGTDGDVAAALRM
ncbi:hypothetical protein [Embleya sp. AB8]|uniref:hypothetical protein n=1 Tax=Embleya sp. AB8 TaxID=3156304 RepID=UPI003C746516